MVTLLFAIPLLLVVTVNALIGLRRGLNKSLIRLMFVAVSVVLTFFLAGPIATAIAQAITVEGQSLGELMASSLASEGTMQTLFDSAPLLRELIMVLPAFAVSLVVFPLVFFILKFLTWVVYLFVQKPLRKLIFRENRTRQEDAERPKKHRLINRLGGVGVGAVTGLIIFGMVITPFCGLAGMMPGTDSVNGLVNSLVEQGQLSASDAELFQYVPAVTDNGVLGFYGFFGAKETGKAYINSVTKVEANGVSTSLGAELSNIMDLAQTVIDSGLLMHVGDPDFAKILLEDKETLDRLLNKALASKAFREAAPNFMADAVEEVALQMNMPANKDAVYQNMMNDIATAVQTAEIDYAGIAAYEAVNGRTYSLLSARAGELMTQEEYEAEIDKLVDLAKKISATMNKALSGDHQEFTDEVAAHIVEEVRNGGQDMAGSLDASAVQGVISGIDASAMDGENAEQLLGQLTDKEKFETDVATIETVREAIRESVANAVADETKAAETATTLANAASDFATAVMNATDENGDVDITKINFDKIGTAITALQNSTLKDVGGSVLDIMTSGRIGDDPVISGMLEAVKDGYDNGKDVGGTISSAGALVNLGAAMNGEGDQEAMVNSLSSLIQNLNDDTIELLPNIFSTETITSMGIPEEYADATYDVLETLLKSLMELKGAEDYENEVNAILELYNIATTGAENLTEDEIAELYRHAVQSDAIYNTMISISTSDPFGIEIADPADRQEMADVIAEVYAKTDRTERDENMARALATLLGVEKELHLG